MADACPKCGGTNGYEGKLAMSYLMTGAWGRDWEISGQEHVLHKPKTVKCVDCGKRVNREVAIGESESPVDIRQS